SHEEQAATEGGKAKDKYAPQHYARLHQVPLAQWLALDVARLQKLWAQGPAKDLRVAVAADGKRLPPQNAPILAKIDDTLGKRDGEKPAAAQTNARGLYEAVGQVTALRRATAPIAIDVLEKIVLPALHMGAPTGFPPLGDDDVENVKKGIDL